MEIEFSFDKKFNKIHYQVNHSDISEDEILEVFSNVYIETELNERITKVIGHTQKKRFLVIVCIINKKSNAVKIITVYPASRKYIIKWNQEVNKND
ncbi:MAG TPA: hypothetical protein P5556_06975 [Candidatus Gastranaerophilales bacterium]|nr:hypothetical protein [Candidatus Gastranaerophilales bacterium]